MTTIKHSEIIRAVLDGKTVQWRNEEETRWHQAQNNAGTISHIVNTDGVFWRIKPATLVTWHPVHADGFIGCSYRSRSDACSNSSADHLLRLERDPETLEVLSCTKEQP